MFAGLTLWDWIVRAFFAFVLGSWLAASAGCTITTKNDGSMFIKFSQGIEIGHTAAKTSDEPATASIDGKALVNHLLDLREDEPNKISGTGEAVDPPSGGE